MKRIAFLTLTILSFFYFISCSTTQKEKKIVVLTFDDAVKSHHSFVAPLLKDYGFGATFFITQCWMNDSSNFLSWDEVADLHKMGFEIGNHSWTHIPFDKPEQAAKLANELEEIELKLAEYDIPKPRSFAWPGNHFGPEAVKVLREKGYKFARRGMQPEIPYGKMQQGPLFDPEIHNGLLIPTTADAYPEWGLDYFKSVVNRGEAGKAIILQFHGVPDKAHPWVNTDPQKFKQFMQYLKENDFTVIALGDLEKYLKVDDINDSMLTYRYANTNN